jgi:hypothetical protein
MVTYDYRDESGTLLYQKVRLEPKDFRLRRPDGQGGWISNLDGTRRVLYRLDELQGREAVVLCEGEKDADRLWSLGIPATTTPDGAKTQPGKNWRSEYTEQLVAANVKRLAATPDNDEAGRVYATDAAAACDAAGITAKVVELPGVPPSGDVSDWLDAGHTKEELLRLLRATPAYDPDAVREADSASDDRVEDTDAGRRTRTAARRVAPSWPAPLATAALHGVFGDIVRLVEPHTEADPAALLLQALVAFGNIIGRRPYFMVGATRHHLNLFTLMVGDTAKARKGTSQQEIFRFFRPLDEMWASDRVSSGLSSGEGLIWAVRDPIEKTKPHRAGGAIDGYETVIEDHGVEDKRLLIVESEFASTLKVLKRDGNTLSPTIRLAWDGGVLNIVTKNSPAKATGAHISIIGHITRHELRFVGSDAQNGFANRFLVACVQRSKFLPDGGCLDEDKIRLIVGRLRDALQRVTQREDDARLHWDDQAHALWREQYRALSSGHPGRLGKMTARSEPQVIRIACLYALAEPSLLVRVEHLRAALAVWRYCFESARYLFGDSTGDDLADQLRDQLRQAGPAGVSRTEMSRALSGNRATDEIDRALELLASHHMARKETDSSKLGRPTEYWSATEDSPTDEINELSP